MRSKCVTVKTAKIFLVIGIVLFVTALILLLVFPSIFNAVLKKELSLSEGTVTTKNWANVPFPLWERVYFFNITNAEDFLKRGEKLNVTQVGPYVYESRWTKPYLKWHPNETVSYKEIRTYQFKQDLSSGGEDDVICTLNGPMLMAASVLKTYSVPIRMLAAFLLELEGEKLIIHKKVGELTYAGYDDFLIKYAPILKPDIPFKDGKFAWLYGKNATDDGVYTVFTGRDDSSKLNIIDKYNGLDKVNFWNGDACNTINGTSLELGPPITSAPTTYTFFQSIFCRSLTYNYTRDDQVFGLDVKRFEPTFDTFANGTDNPDNACFDLGSGLPSGMINLSNCQFGASVGLSHPHFYMADSSYLNSVNGLLPNNAGYTSYVSVEPTTGMSIDFVIRLQLNLMIERIKGLVQMDNMREGTFPVLWVELQGKIDQEIADMFHNLLFRSKVIINWTLGAIMVLSFLLCVGSVVAIVILKKKEDCEDDPLIDSKEERKAKGPSKGSINREEYGTESNVTVVGGVQSNALVVNDETNHTAEEGRTYSRNQEDDDAPILTVDEEVSLNR